ncbi:efflux transporter outer membrane subunit [Phenylobacterium deserti]|uniref:RND transporter n=1 Tax=Phenylobacterium deserti TaxID=1914756 RepID=A0A328ASM5_9CAUL|nr:efflux transporter outer membrane subunit [Phenylobacterium deserti]RAK58073.1 RND transporter [Phenylobacterium deserti]
MPLPITKSLRVLALSASALTLAACATVGPNFQTPAAPQGAAASGYAAANDPAPRTLNLSPEARAAGPWWQAFGSPELDAAVRQALADSPTIAEAEANLAKANAQLAAVRGREGVQADVSAGAQRQRVNTAAFGISGFPSPTINLFSVGGTVSYDLDLFGGQRRAAEAAAARAEAEAREADAAYLTLTGNVALQAMRIAGLRAQIAAVEQIVADDQRVIDMVRRAQRAGGEAPSAITGGQAQLAEDQALLPPLQRELTAARHQLALLSGRSPAEYSAADFDLARLSAPTAVPVSLPSELVRRRPDILASEAELHEATAEIGVAAAAQYPNLALSAGLTQTALKPENLFNYSASGWNVLTGVTAPIFHGGTLRANRQAAEAEARAALARYQQTVIRAFGQVSDVLSALATDEQSIEALTRAQGSAQAGVRDAEAAYRLGGGTLLQVVDAQRQLSRARRALAQAEAQRYADLVQLYAATAADWRTSA